MTTVDLTEEAAAFRTAFRGWAKNYAAMRRGALLTGKVAPSAETDFRSWSRCYFNQPVDLPEAHEAPSPAADAPAGPSTASLATVLESFWIPLSLPSS